jgi:hypothetical protein
MRSPPAQHAVWLSDSNVVGRNSLDPANHLLPIRRKRTARVQRTPSAAGIIMLCRLNQSKPIALSKRSRISVITGAFRLIAKVWRDKGGLPHTATVIMRNKATANSLHRSPWVSDRHRSLALSPLNTAAATNAQLIWAHADYGHPRPHVKPARLARRQSIRVTMKSMPHAPA